MMATYANNKSKSCTCFYYTGVGILHKKCIQRLGENKHKPTLYRLITLLTWKKCTSPTLHARRDPIAKTNTENVAKFCPRQYCITYSLAGMFKLTSSFYEWILKKKYYQLPQLKIYIYTLPYFWNHTLVPILQFLCTIIYVHSTFMLKISTWKERT
jgi:hypothetical protein